MNKKKITIIIVIILAILLVGFIVWKNINKNNIQDDGKLKIVTSFYPIYIIAENITEGANNIELENMADVNVGCLHDYTLTTEDMKKVEKADVFVINGLGMENFIDKVINSNNTMQVIDSSSGIENIIKNDDETNAHIWTNINNYITQVKNISERLQQIDSKNANIYKENEENYINQLEKLEEEYIQKLEGLKGKKVVNLNEAFEYLGQELQMEMTTIETNHEESTMSAEMMSSIIEKMKNENIQMILVDKNDNKTMAETIANETGAKIYELDSGLKGSIERDAYINMVKYNMEILQN